MRKLYGGLLYAATLAFFSFLLVQAKEAQLGSLAPDFTLQDTAGKPRSLSDFKGKYVVLEWTNPECPFVKKHYGSQNMQNLQKAWKQKDVAWLSICSFAEEKQGFFEPKDWQGILKERGSSPTAMLLDPDGRVGGMYAAKTTPHMFIVNPQGVLIYKGAIDDKRSVDPEDIKDAKNFVSLALEEAMAGKPVKFSSTQSYGCSIKYK